MNTLLSDHERKYIRKRHTRKTFVVGEGSLMETGAIGNDRGVKMNHVFGSYNSANKNKERVSRLVKPMVTSAGGHNRWRLTWPK